MAKKTLKTLINDREKQQAKLDKINSRIVKMINISNTEPLYLVSSTASYFKNDNQIDLTLVNENFFCLDHVGYAFASVNIAPKDFKRFIAACIELYNDYLEIKKKERRINKLKEKKQQIDKEISKVH